MTDRFIVYGLVDPRTDEVRYIGKSSSGIKRPLRHMLPAVQQRDTNRHKVNWIRSLQKLGTPPTVRILETSVDAHSCAASESAWIKQAREQGWALTNFTGGGEGLSGRICTAETRLKISVGNTGKIHPPRTEAYRANLSRALTGIKRSPETRARISAAKLGKKRNLSIEQRQAISERLRQRIRSPLTLEAREKIATGLLVYRVSKETKQVIDHTGRVWPNKYAASETLGLLVSQITRCLNGKIRSTGGFGFRYV